MSNVWKTYPAPLLALRGFCYPNMGQNDARPKTPGFRRSREAHRRHQRHPPRDPRPLFAVADVPAWLARVGGVRPGLSQVDIDSRVLHVTRLKDGLSTTHPLRGDEIRAIKAWLADRARMKPETDAFFISERRRPLSRKTAWLMIRDYGRLAGLPVEAHPHMLRHACGFALADQGADTRLIQDYLGHRNIQHTVRYTATNPARFERLWR